MSGLGLGLGFRVRVRVRFRFRFRCPLEKCPSGMSPSGTCQSGTCPRSISHTVLALMLSLQVFSWDGATMAGRLLGSTICVPHTAAIMHSVKFFAQEHNKQACWHVLHTIPILLSAKQESCEYHF